MGFRIKNRCTTSVTLVLDGIAVTIPAGEVSAIHKSSLFSGADCKLLNAGLLIMIPWSDGDNDLRQPLDKNVVASKASDRTVDIKAKKSKKPTAENPPWLNPDGSAKTEENNNSITDKKSGG